MEQITISKEDFSKKTDEVVKERIKFFAAEKDFPPHLITLFLLEYAFVMSTLEIELFGKESKEEKRK